MDNLKPCPFCGSDAGEQDIIIVGRGLCKMVFCEKCHIDFKNPTSIEQWNTRPAEDALTAEVERLKGEVARIKMLITYRRDVLLNMIKSRHEAGLINEYNTMNILIEAINNPIKESEGEE